MGMIVGLFLIAIALFVLLPMLIWQTIVLIFLIVKLCLQLLQFGFLLLMLPYHGIKWLIERSNAAQPQVWEIEEPEEEEEEAQSPEVTQPVPLVKCQNCGVHGPGSWMCGSCGQPKRTRVKCLSS